MSESIGVSQHGATSNSTYAKLRVCIAIPTFRRPRMLESLLDGIKLIVVPRNAIVEIIVIDNDTLPSALDLVASLRDHFPFPLSYAHVAEAGLSSVRNFALERTERDYDFVAMIDDDEVPQPQWLSELLRIQNDTQADGVVGPVPRIIPTSAPRWLRNGHFFDLPRYCDGHDMRDGYSGNCLLRVDSVKRLGLRFDPTFNFAGGEDLLFFREMRRRGGKLVFASQAVAVESVEPSRLSGSYVLKLNFRRGNTLSRCDLRLFGSKTVVIIRALKSFGCVARGFLTLIPRSVLNGRTGCVVALSDIARGFGGLAGLWGYTYHMYRRNDSARN